MAKMNAIYGKRRVGVIEIGSRAVRLLVAEVSATVGVHVITTGVEGCDLLEKSNQSQFTVRQEITKVCESVKRFRMRAQQHDAEEIVVIGTEALRRIAETDSYNTSQLAKNVDRILDGRSEAMYSLIAGSFSLAGPYAPQGNCLLVDQGFGSMEIAYGKLGPPVKLLEYVSVDLGVRRLLHDLASCGRDMNALKRDVSDYFDDLNLPEFKPDHAVVLGSVATKYAWLKLERKENEKYSPKRVDGERIQTKTMEADWAQIARLASRSGWAIIEEFMSPSDRGKDEGKRLVAGIVPLAYIMNRFKQKNFVVSALGTRHGLALDIGLGRPSFFDSDSGGV